MSPTTTLTDPATSTKTKRWVAFGAAGAIGTIHTVDGGYAVKLLADTTYRGIYPKLDVAKSALYACLVPGTDWPEFREH